jgi:hypothetical protein
MCLLRLAPFASVCALASEHESRVPANFNYDLSSHAAEINAAHSAPVNIQVGGITNAAGIVQGGAAKTINPAALITPAEFVAVQQILATGKQNLLLGSRGNAIGGQILLTQADPGSSALTAINNGTIDASNDAGDSSIVGFHSGPGQDILITGTGTILGGASYNIGNLNLDTLSLASANAVFLTFDQASCRNVLSCNAVNCGSSTLNTSLINLSTAPATTLSHLSPSTLLTAASFPQTRFRQAPSSGAWMMRRNIRW